MRQLLTIIGLTLLNTMFLSAQSTCGTPAAPPEWDNWFNKQVEAYKENLITGKAQTVNYTIPVVVHVIHFGEVYGTYPNIDSAQIQSQIVALNKDFAGTGDGVSQVPPAFANLVANTGIQFCLATKTPSGGIMLERGADRISAPANSWLNPNTSTLNLQDYFKTVIIPATIWDPNKYLNIWISDKAANYPLNGFATYPSGTSLNGLFNGTMGSLTNDGIWCWTKAFGTVGTLTAPWNQGRTATHELGHWLGLRHIWGDGNCLSDYCDDTPTTKQAHTGCLTSTPVDQCGVNSSPFGEMPMNFMDRSDDACMYMFTKDQNIRIQTAMSQSSLRNLLGTHSICTATPQPSGTSSAVASFNMGADACLDAPITPFNTSSGYPKPTFVWSTSPAAQIQPAFSVANPAITFNNPGTYTVTLVATNSLSSSTYSMVVNANFTCSPFNPCVDSVKMIKKADTLKSYTAPSSTLNFNCQQGKPLGYLAGTNCYKDREFAQFYPANSYTGIPYPQVNSVIVLFNSKGTKAAGGTSTVTCRIRGGSVGTGPGGGFNTASKSELLSNIQASPQQASVGYLGIPGYAVNNNIIPYKFNFPQPVVLASPNAGFFACVEAPFNSPNDSINLYHSSRFNSAVDSSAWYRQSNDIWRTFRAAQNRNAKIQLAIIPEITCSAIAGVNELSTNTLQANVNLMPNPSEGMFSLVFTLPEEEDINIRILNTLGQTVSYNSLSNITSTVIDVDMSNQPEGVYFAEISSGIQKTGKKIIIRH
jgi:hypothetical protein